MTVERTVAERNGEAGAGGVSRRVFIRSALLGAAAIPIAACTDSGGSATTMAPGQTTTSTTVPPGAVPFDARETWTEPWIWRPSDWPGQQLHLNVVENENPGPIVGFGNQSAVLFSYNGATPGPTIRMKGDEILYLRLRNLLDQNFGTTYVGPYPDPRALPQWVKETTANEKSTQLGNARKDYCLGEHTNGVHSVHVTNLHTHGLHVRPGRNPDGTHSDNVILRLINQADFRKRQEERHRPECEWLRDPDQLTYLRDDEQTGYADYEFRIGDVQAAQRDRDDLPPQPHPPGTHWYHPHSHGATHNQVASGMAGFLIVEGDVDEAINLALTGQRSPDPQLKQPPYDYLERLMFVQRVFVNSNAVDPDAPTQTLKMGGAANPAVNGDQTPMVIRMRPGAIERWRVLNGSVDGRGFKRFMVLEGQYDVFETGPPGGTMSTLMKLADRQTGEFKPASRSQVSADKHQLYQLAFDGVTLVEPRGNTAVYTIADLADQNRAGGGDNPLDRPLEGNPNQAMLRNFEACYEDATSVRNCYVQPNEVYLGPANRTDVLFQAPRLDDGVDAAIFTVLARAVIVHADNYQNKLQSSYTSNTLAPPPQDIVVAYIVVQEGSGEPVPDYKVLDLRGVLPEVPQYLRPVRDEEVQVRAGDPDAGLPGREGSYRTRTIVYSGWGAADYPLVTTVGDGETARKFREFVAADGGRLESLRYAAIPDHEGEHVLLAPNLRTMAITGSTSDDIVDSPIPLFRVPKSMGRKFDPTDPQRPMMLENTAEEWALYNYSISLWADTSVKPVGQSGGHYEAQPLTRAEGQRRFAGNQSWRLQTKSVDHPFHIHQNPCWVTRIEIPDQDGNLVNILDRPRWQDVMWIPRNGGRVVFRSRFPDYIGAYVNHCHILLHEDNGMMQVIEITPFAEQADYEPKDEVAGPGDDAEAVTRIYPRYDQARAWLQSMRFVDPNHATGQLFPGFELGPPPG